MVLFTYTARPPPQDTDWSFRKTMKSLIAIPETGMSLVSQDSVTQMTSALFWRVTHSSSSTLQVKERVLEIRRGGIDALGWTQGRDKNAQALLTSECKWDLFKQFKFSHRLWDLKSWSSFTRFPDLFPQYLKISLSFRTAISVVSMITCLQNLLSWSLEYCSETWI